MNETNLLTLYGLIFSFFIAIYFSFIQELAVEAEHARNKIIKAGKKKSVNYDEYYKPIINFVAITSKYFTLLGWFILVHILKFIWSSISSVIVFIIYFTLLAWYFSRIWKIISCIHQSIFTRPQFLLGLYFVTPSILWFCAYKFLGETYIDLFSVTLMIIYTGFWFIIYTEIFSPLSNLRKLIELISEA